MNMLLDFAMDYLGFSLMVCGFILGARTLMDITIHIGKGIRSWRDVELDEWVDLAVCGLFLMVGRLMTLY